jgi:hypothetical protein
MQIFVCAILFLFMTVFAAAEEQPYRDASKFAMRAFYEHLKKNGPILKDAEMLRLCGREGLAKAVEAKEQDLMIALEKTAFEHPEALAVEHIDLDTAIVVSTSIRVMFIEGFKQGAKMVLDTPHGKEIMCNVAVKIANDILH